MSVFQAVPSGYVLTSGAGSALTWTNAVSVSSMTVSSLGANSLTVSTLTTSTSVTSASLAASTLTVSSITANSVGYSTLSGSTINATRLNYSSLVGSSISTNAMTLSLTNASTQNTQIYQVATTNPTTSYTAIQASHVSTGTTYNALALNPSGGNVGVGTTAPQSSLDIVGAMRVGDPTSSSFIMHLGNTGVGGYRSGYLYGDGTNIKIANQQNGAMTFDANNGERMRISATGNVGIGTATPAQLLDITNATSATPAIRLQSQYAAAYMSMGVNVGVNSYIGLQAGAATTSALGTPTLAVSNNGGVGIGTTTPAAILHVNGASYPSIKLSDSTNTSDYMEFIRHHLSNESLIRTTGTLHFETPANYKRMTILPSGNVGIGKTDPTASLHVLNPTAQAGNTTMVTAQIIGRPGTAGVQDGTSCGFAIGASGGLPNAASRMDVMVGGTAYSGNNWGYTPDIPVATFLGSGNVGIGTTAPGYKLEVNGVLRSMGTVGVTPAGATTSIMHYWWTGSQFAFSADNVLFYYISPNSDYRIKENIQTPSPILNRLCAVNMIEYEFKTNGIMKTDGKRLGVFAHELQEAFPEYPNMVIGAKDAVNEDGSIRIQSISGEAIGYLVMKSVQELASQATSQAALVQELSTQLAATQQQLAAKSAALDALIAWAQTQGYSVGA